MRRCTRIVLMSVLIASSASIAPALAEDWPSWRGVAQVGTSTETGLVDSWSVDGENMIWKAPFIGRSTPVVTHGQVCVIGRVGDGVDKQEVVACFDAGTGKKNWERRHNVYHTTVAFNRLGWAALAADPDTGNIYAHGAAGQLIAFSKRGDVLWERFLLEDFGRASGYGGRTQTPIVWGDQLILTNVSIGWGDQAAPRHRLFSFDKSTGELQWVSTPGAMVFDMNVQTAPVVAEIDGRHLVISGNADGHVYAVELSTGKKIWSFPLSRRGLNSSVVVAGDVVFVSHGEENLDDPTQGRLVAFRGTGSGDISGQEIWRINEMKAGFPTPAYHDGKLYHVDNSANLSRIDAKSGTIDWEYSLGTVGKASPVIADGKMYVPETNGRFHVLRLADGAPVALDHDELQVPEGDRYAEIYGSVAIAYGRIYLATEGWLYCIGKTGARFDAGRPTPKATMRRGRGDVAGLTVTPADLVAAPGETVRFVVHAFDAIGRPLGTRDAKWSLEGLDGDLAAPGRFTAPGDSAEQAGYVVATVGAVSVTSRVRIIPNLPWSEGFETFDVDGVPATWIGAKGKFKVIDKDGDKVLVQPVRGRGLQRSKTFFGGDFSDYTISADVMGSRDKRRVTDVGLINAGYVMDLMGYHQRIEIRSWAAEKRMAQTTDFEWEMGVWYRMKLEVRPRADSATIRGKVWKRGEPEPAAWTIVAEDPLPVRHGSPGLIGYAPAEAWYDNITVNPNR